MGVPRSTLYKRIDNDPRTPIIKKFNKQWFEGLKKAPENTDASHAYVLKSLGLSDEEILSLKALNARVNQSLRTKSATAEKQRRGAEDAEKAAALKASGMTTKSIAAELKKTPRAVLKMLQRAKK